MPTMINDLTIEPKANPPAETAGGGADKKGGGGKSGPELERELMKVYQREHERKLRMWAH